LDILEIRRNEVITEERIKDAYKAAVKKYQSDNEKFKRVNLAKRTLIDDDNRAAYFRALDKYKCNDGKSESMVELENISIKKVEQKDSKLAVPDHTNTASTGPSSTGQSEELAAAIEKAENYKKGFIFVSGCCILMFVITIVVIIISVGAMAAEEVVEDDFREPDDI